MREDVLLGPAGEVEKRAVGQVAEGGARQLLPALAGEAAVELGAERVEVEHVGGGVGQLTVLGGAGLSLEAYDAAGAPIAGTVLFDSVQSVDVPVDGDSSVLYVRVGEEWYEVTTNDPDWGLD